ncbi:DUF1730 domain-containing protein [bacterium]|nr:DUF1730 domain-containing protein [bacterium]
MLPRSMLQSLAREAGVPLCGAAAVAADGRAATAVSLHLHPYDPDTAAFLPWLERTRVMRSDIRTFLPGARSVVACAFPYASRMAGHTGVVARYACGEDYHTAAARRLGCFAALLSAACGGVATRWCSDTSPVSERYWAAAAGIGWTGRNGCLITAPFGSWVVLGIVATAAAIEPAPPVHHGCGDCHACITACPTGALEPGGMCRIGRCISFWTVEARTAIPPGIRERMGDSRFGCDRCQAVCPFNEADCGAARLFEPDGRIVAMDAGLYEQCSSGEFLGMFRGTAVARSVNRGARVVEHGDAPLAPDA